MPLRPRKKRGGGLYWLLAVVGVVFLGWMLWKSARGSGPRDRPPLTGMSRLQSNLLIRIYPPVSATNRPSAPVSTLTNNPPAQFINTIPGRLQPQLAKLPAENIFAIQLALTRQCISCGSLDGVLGSQTRAALRALQQREGLTPTGELDEPTQSRLVLDVPLYTTYTVTSNDLARLQPLRPTWLGKSEQDRLDYETILELVAEMSHAHQDFIRRLNPGIDWNALTVGTPLKLPNAEYPPPRAKAAFVRIRLGSKTLQVFDASTNLLAHFPCSIARRVEKRPAGELHVAKIAPNPSYRFDPEIFPESEEGRQLGRQLMIAPGPNNPVGTTWIGLDKPGYGIHGTPRPEEVGRTESHGCFRLANWNADYLLRLVGIGTLVMVEP